MQPIGQYLFSTQERPFHSLEACSVYLNAGCRDSDLTMPSDAELELDSLSSTPDASQPEKSRAFSEKSSILQGSVAWQIGSQDLHVFLTVPEEIQNLSLLEEYKRLLSDQEFERYTRFRFEKNKKQFLVSHALVRTTLSRYAPVAPQDWQFSTNQYGKPEIIWPSGTESACRLKFSLSHTDGASICAVTLQGDIGADVEDSGRRGETVELADRFFSPIEASALRALPESKQRARFFEYWTLKEAYLKALGTGLNLPLDCFSLEVDRVDRVPFSGHLACHLAAQVTELGALELKERRPAISFHKGHRDDSLAWRFALMQLSERHTSAIALRQNCLGSVKLRYWRTVPLID